ncbi:MarR family transcriptional regulator [Brucepastera parasyntrophica]|uniref:MarR family winged helix-turn-helix transcriptional regulator n=1 Tax=Brucepastera parasyntrophica TaxID=2880008 RepID=UPI0021099C47|nr:MarR family transcriptional regulator [Brucepastera parasyntrophica]ULQ60991.1 MarR family transcriptional regulator [Brucepastera parasyntrophica]
MIPEFKAQITAINSATSRINGLYGKWAQKRKVNHYAMDILYLLLTEGPLTQKKFREEFEIPKQSVNNVITSLKNAGYIILEASPEDRREKIILLTKKGLRYSEKLLAPLFEIEEAVIRRMGPRMMRQMIEATAVYGNFLEQEMEKKAGALI